MAPKHLDITLLHLDKSQVNMNITNTRNTYLRCSTIRVDMRHPIHKQFVFIIEVETYIKLNYLFAEVIMNDDSSKSLVKQAT